MKRLALLSLIGLVILAGTALAQTSIVQSSAPYPTQYWVNGTLLPGTYTGALDGFQVVLYRDSGQAPNAYADAYSDTAGRFDINAFEDLRLNLAPGTYYIGVVQKNGYGVNEQTMLVSQEGWNPVTLTLKLGEGIPPITGEDGQIVNTIIERVADAAGSDVRLRWEIGQAGIQAGVTAVDIWSNSGANAEFDRQATWTKLNSSPIAQTTLQYVVTEKVGDGTNAYYRVVPAGTAAASIQQSALNNYAVGKVDVALKSEYNSICYPFTNLQMGIDTVVGDQLTEGDQVHYWDWSKQQYSILTMTTAWPAYTFKNMEGFFVYLVPAATRQEVISLVGRISLKDTYSQTLKLEYNLVGYPYPVSGDAATIGIVPREGDQIHQWNWDSQQFAISTYVSAWNKTDLTTFKLGEGKFYYIPTDKTSLPWTLTQP